MGILELKALTASYFINHVFFSPLFFLGKKIKI